MKPDNCNCIGHYDDGFAAGVEREQNKYRHPEILMTYREIERLALVDNGQLQGRYALTVFHNPEINPTLGYKSWQIGLKILTEKCGTRVTKIIFEPNVEVESYAFGLVEE
jgi:hypothetical protein